MRLWKTKPRHEPEAWRPFFAWFPTMLISDEVVWLETVETRLYHGVTESGNVYRRVGSRGADKDAFQRLFEARNRVEPPPSQSDPLNQERKK